MRAPHARYALTFTFNSSLSVKRREEYAVASHAGFRCTRDEWGVKDDRVDLKPEDLCRNLVRQLRLFELQTIKNVDFEINPFNFK